MTHSRLRQLSLNVGYVLWLGGLAACATGVTQEFEDEASPIGKGTGGSGGSASVGNESGSTSVPQAGSTSSGGGGNPFGGTTSTAGQDGGGTAGSDVGEGGAGSETGGTGGGGASAGSAGSGGAGGGSGGSGTGPCGCGKTLAWTDNTVLNWVTGDCLTVTVEMVTTTYKYTGTKAQTYANGQCNPAKQEPWCPESGNDYKFMLCP